MCQHVYEVRPRKDNGVDLISDQLPFRRLWYGEPNASDFVIKEITAPHTNGMKGGFFPRAEESNYAPSRCLSGTMPDCCDKIALGHASAPEL
jgi:hypothetical protein